MLPRNICLRTDQCSISGEEGPIRGEINSTTYDVTYCSVIQYVESSGEQKKIRTTIGRTVSRTVPFRCERAAIIAVVTPRIGFPTRKSRHFDITPSKSGGISTKDEQ